MSKPVTLRSTKAEILAVLEAQTIAMQAGPTWRQIAVKVCNVAVSTGREIAWLMADCYEAVRTARRWYDQAMAELTRPLIKP